MSTTYCNNCGKPGHVYHQCKFPIISIGIVAFRIARRSPGSLPEIEYLMICRRDTLGFIDFMRGKYSIHNKEYIMNMLKQMTVEEKHNLKTLSFDQLWFKIWGNELISNQYRSEESVSREKFTTLHNGVFTKHEYYTLSSMIEESEQYESWTEPEWGFPKGRRKFQERDYECALREFAEETGYDTKHVRNITNIVPFEETFTGSNYKSYKHKYFLAYMDYSASIRSVQYEPTEVSQLEWKTYEQCIQSIRPYNLEKKRLLTNIHTTLQEVILYDESK